MIADSVAFCRARGQARHLRRRALLRRLARRLARYALECLRAAAAARSRERHALRHERLEPAGPGRRGDGGRGRRARRPGRGRDPHPQRRRVRRRQLARGRRGRARAWSRARSTATASAAATPTWSRSCPALQLKLGYECVPEDRLRAAHRDRPLRRRAHQPRSPDPDQPYVGPQRLRPQGRDARGRRPGRRAHVRAHRPRAGRQQPRGPDLRALGQGLGALARRATPASTSTPTRRAARVERRQGARAPRLPLRGRRRLVRAAAAPRGGRLRAAVPPRELPGDHREARRRPGRDRGDDQDLGRRPALRAHGRGQRPGQRARQGAARRDHRAPSRTWPTSSSSTTRSGILDEHHGTGAVTRVLLDSSDGERPWGTIGVSENIIEASWEALVESLEYAFQPEAETPRRRDARPERDPARRARRRARARRSSCSRSCAPGRLSLGPDAGAVRARPSPPASGSTDAVAVSSGTAALHLGVRRLGWGEGDEVVTSPFSFVASANCLLYEGATPVFCDVDPVTLNIDPAAAEAAVGERTAGLLPVAHLRLPGRAAGARARSPRDRGLGVLEDACEALGAARRRRAIGRRARQPRDLRLLRQQADHDRRGRHARRRRRRARRARCAASATRAGRPTWAGSTTTAWASTTGSATCRRRSASPSSSARDELLAARERVAALYARAPRRARRRARRARATRRASCCPARTAGRSGAAGSSTSCSCRPTADRDAVIADLAQRGIASKAYLPCIHLMPLYRERFGFRGGEFPVAEDASRARSLALPFFGAIDRGRGRRVAEALAEALRGDWT